MKNVYKKLNILQKLGIIIIALTMVIGTMPGGFLGDVLSAEEAKKADVNVENTDTDTKKISVSTQEATYNTVVLMKADTEIIRGAITVDAPAVFYVQTNGTYTLRIENALGETVETQTVEIKDFRDIRVEPISGSNTLKITGRITGGDHFVISDSKVKQEVAVTLVADNTYTAEFTPTQNDTYSIAVIDKAGNQLGDSISYEVTTLTNDQPAAQTAPTDEIVHLQNQTDLKKINDNLSGNYVLDRDIVISDTNFEPLVSGVFSGTLDGKGYQIKGLKQPLFTTVTNAHISALSLQGDWKNKNGALLAMNSSNSNYDGIAINVDITGKEQVAGMLYNASHDTITKSFVSGSIQGKSVSGFVANGTAMISDSYVSGMLSAEKTAVGFGMYCDISNSYLAATVSAETMTLFNTNTFSLIGAIYDSNLQKVEDTRAMPFTTSQLTASSLPLLDPFLAEKNSYPMIKQGFAWNETAAKSEAISRIALSLRENINGISEDVSLPEKREGVALKWSTDGEATVSNNELQADVVEDATKAPSGVLKMRSDYGVLALQTASATSLDESPLAGKSLAETTTSISFNATENFYYIVKEKSEAAPTAPKDHETAINSSWKRYLWTGIINWPELKWNTDYVLYEYDLATKTLKPYPIKTSKGTIGGSISFSTELAVDKVVTATLSDDALCKAGYWSWEKSKSLSSGWTGITDYDKVDEDSLTSSYTPSTKEAGYYLRATFHVSSDQDYEGTAKSITASVITEALTSVTIYNKSDAAATDSDMVVGTLLHAAIAPTRLDTEVKYYWYHEGDDTIQGTGKEYKLSGKDVDKLLYAKAVSKVGGGASGTVESTHTIKIKKAVTAAPTVTPQPGPDASTDISVSVKMPDSIREGLFQFGYKKSGAGAGDPTAFATLARGHDPVTITGLDPNSSYYIFAREIGENGYEDSKWGTKTLSLTTEKEHIKGTVEITGSSIYGQTLVSKITNGNSEQTFDTTWYRVASDGKEVQIGTGESREINLEQAITERIKVVYKGNGLYAGEISAMTDTVKKAEVIAPSNPLSTTNCVAKSDTTLELVLPAADSATGGLSKSEKFIVGYSLTKGGVPVEYREDGKVVTYDPSKSAAVSGDNTVILKDFKRNTKYYLFLRYSETTTHYKSDWSSIDNCINLTTQKTPYSGIMSFAYATTGKAIQGEKLKAEIAGGNTTDGTWAWNKINKDGSKSAVTNFFPDGDSATYIMIPNTDVAIGSKYEASFTPNKDFSASTSATSHVVEKFVKEKYATPDVIPSKTSNSDGSLTFQMTTGTTGAIYQFRYSKGTDVSSATDVSVKAYKGTDVTLSGLDRNTSYHIWVSQAGDDVKDASDWSSTYLTITTDKTDLHGYVSIDDIPIVNEPLVATYNTASYIPAGDDSKGSWQWFRKDSSGFVAISGATSASYTPVSDDIGKELQAKYTGTGDFKSVLSVSSDKTKKPVAVDPNISSCKQIADDASGRLVIGAQFDSGTWFRLQKSAEDSPTLPSSYSDSDFTAAKWSKNSSSSLLSLTKDFNGDFLSPKTTYILYIVKAETDTSQASNIISNTTETSELVQSGSIAISGDAVVSKVLTASLSASSNNDKGTWKWYASKTDCGDGSTPAPAISDTSKWDLISSGYAPSVNSKSSKLTLPDGMLGKYIRAEFVADATQFYKGTLQSPASSFIKKVYNESLTLTSSTTDGDGNPKAYSGTTVTATIKNYAESKYLNETRNVAKFSVGSTDITPSAFAVDTVANTASFTYTFTADSAFDNQIVSASVSRPKAPNLFVLDDGSNIPSSPLSSADSKSNFNYAFGIPISSPDDLDAFMTASGKFTDRSSAAKYILTSNINMSSKGIVNYSEADFGATLDGDFHTIVGTKNPLFAVMRGGTIRNTIFSNALVDTTTLAEDRPELNAGSIIARTTYNALVEKIMIVNSNVITKGNGGILIGDASTTNINECFTAGGSIKPASGGSIGGFTGAIRANSVVNNAFSINTDVLPGAINTGGFTGVIGNDNTFQNIFMNTKLDPSRGYYQLGMLSAPAMAKWPVKTNVFYDQTISSDPSLVASGGKNQITPKSTQDMIGNGLNVFGTDKWTYRDGSYPVLKWADDHPVAKLYTATRGAFVSVGNSPTSATDMFNGTLNGVVEVPTELRKKGYTYTSSNPSVLDVSKGGTITPIGAVNSSADITITYTDSITGSNSVNSYTFTIGKQMSTPPTSAMSGTANIGQKLSVPAGYSYQWYRRKPDTTVNKVISGATSKDYTLTPDDMGYEIGAEITANGITVTSNFSSEVGAAAPTSITITDLTDNSLKAKATLVTDANYEYAYSATDGGAKTIAGKDKEIYTMSGLERNKSYYIYARVAGASDNSYSAGPWSKGYAITTNKTDIDGSVTLSSNINMGQTLTASVADTNMQTGTWKLERVNATTGAVSATLTPTSSTAYTLSYVLTKADTGSKIKVSYSANGSFKDRSDGVATKTSKEILKQNQTAPSTPVKEANSVSDHIIKVKQTQTDGDTVYQFGYRKDMKDEIVILDGTYATNVAASITGLDRNTNYYVYARKAAKDDYEASAWSAAVQITTNKTDIKTSAVTMDGVGTVDNTVVFSIDNADTNVSGQTGLWVLERIGDGMKNTLIGTTSDETHKLTYALVPEDSGYQLKATYVANGDYDGSVSYTTPTDIINNTQTLGAVSPTVSEVKVYTATAYVSTASSDIYEFGYRKSGELGNISVYPVTATWGNSVNVGPLDRNSGYDIFVRKAAKTGYDASEWSTGIPVQTKKEQLKGNITFGGTTAVNDTLIVAYEKGIYDYTGEDGTGTWQWYLDGEAVVGETSTSFKITPMNGNPKVSVKYTAKENSGFEGTLERSFGKVFKPEYAVPPAATVKAKAEDNTQEGSTLHITNAEVDNVYVYLRLADNDLLPPLKLTSEVVTGLDTASTNNIERWIPAASTMDIRVPSNRTYIVYSARLENDTNTASEISSARGVLSAKEPMTRSVESNIKIEDSDVTVTWKALQEKTLSYSLYGKAPTAVWKYYVQGPDDSFWQNIDTELNTLGRVDEVKNGVMYSTISLPMKYKGYKLKVELIGSEDYSGMATFFPPDPIEGRLINTGGSKITASDQTRLLDVLKADYSGGDDVSGSFVWYRVSADGKTKVEVKKDTPNITSSYQLQKDDLDHYVYAEYQSAPTGLYSGVAKTDEVLVSAKAVQNTPDAVVISQVNGNSVQVTAPENYNRSDIDRTPQAMMGYQMVDQTGKPIDASITWQIGDAIGNNWFKKLQKNSYYVFYVQYLGTGVYAPSSVSAPSAIVKTENEAFEVSNLKITMEKANDDATAEQKKVAVIGDSITATYQKDGYDEGYFALKRNNGQVISAKAEGTVDADKEQTSYTYTYTAEDVGNSVIVEYHAADDALHYDGYVERSTKKVVAKEPNAANPTKPVLERGLDTDLVAAIDSTYEYVLSDSTTAPAPSSGEWNVLNENMTSKPGYHDFLGLERTTTYYLHARIAETKENTISKAITSEGKSPEPYIDMSKLTVNNTSDDTPAMATGTKVAFPYTLKAGTLKLSDLKLVNDLDKSAVVLGLDTSLYMNSDGTTSLNTVEAGSDWANQNFGCAIRLYDKDDALIDSSLDDKATLDSTGATKMTLEFYRANAVTKGGTYTLEMLITDAEGKSALLQSKVEMATDITAVVPIKVKMNLIDKEYLKQDSNTEGLRNESGMPVEISIDKQAVKGTGLPDLKGIYRDGTKVNEGEAYLKISNDFSNYSSQWNGVWLQSDLSTSQLIPFVKLGNQAFADYYVSGIANKDQTWPWADSSAKVKTIEQAYQFRFVTKVSKEKKTVLTKEKMVFKEE